MIICIIAAICIIGGIIWGAYDTGEVIGGLLGGLMGFIASIFISIIIGGLAHCIWDCYGTDNIIQDTEQIELIALKDNFGVEGQNYLFSGYINEELHYIFIYEDPVKGMITGRVDADETYIKYIEPDERPYIQKWIERPRSNFLYNFFALGIHGNTIYLPQGSVITDAYEIDLE